MSALAPRRCRPPGHFWLGAGAALAALALSTRAQAAEPCRDVDPWSRLGTTGSNFVRPLPLALTGLAVAAPFGFAPTGLDHQIRVWGQRDLGGEPRLEPVSVATPYVLAGGLLIGYGISAALDSCAGKRAISPVLQAGVLTFATVGLLKFGTGRDWPNGGHNGGSNPSAPDRLDHPERAHDFQPFTRVYMAWPSGHTAIMFAAASAFRASNPQLGWVSWLGYPLAVGVAGGMWLGDHHWGSDIVSGAFLGEAIGSSVGQSFSQALGMPGALTVFPQHGNTLTVQWLTVW